MSNMKKCVNCGRPYKPLSFGLCAACYRYERRVGKKRPYGKKDGRAIAAVRGPAHYAWKGDAARPETKRARAQRKYPIKDCQECGREATERHHIDDDTGNNDPENIMILCRRCHMKIDGRLEIFLSYRNTKKVPPLPCDNCKRLAKPLRRGLCHACNEYQRRNGITRPYKVDGRKERFN